MPYASDDGALTFTIAVAYTDRTRLPDRRFVTKTTLVHVLADTELEANLLAAQWVDSTRPYDYMVLATRMVQVIA